MKTKIQVIDDFVRLQKKYLGIRGFVTVRAYDQGNGYWSVELQVYEFNESSQINWSERVEWYHYEDNQAEAQEKANAEAVEEFIKRMEERI